MKVSVVRNALWFITSSSIVLYLPCNSISKVLMFCTPSDEKDNKTAVQVEDTLSIMHEVIVAICLCKCNISHFNKSL